MIPDSLKNNEDIVKKNNVQFNLDDEFDLFTL